MTTDDVVRRRSRAAIRNDRHVEAAVLVEGDGGDMTTTCLQNILVLSAGATMQPDARGQAMPD